MKNFAVLASGNGGNLQAIINAVKKGRIKASLELVLSDRSDAFALQRARKAGIDSVHFDPKAFSSREEFDRKVISCLKEAKIDFVVLAGYMRLLSPLFIKTYPRKILNIHPALLPSFKGMHGIKDAFEYGVKVTGVSVHFVSEEMDAGEIIAQDVVRITPKDTLQSLSRKIHRLEHKIYPKVIGEFVRRNY
jgi:phosphoribosylglycinamide formyltransferase-1